MFAQIEIMFSLSHSGNYGWGGNCPVHRPSKHSGNYVYSDASLRRLKNAELAVIGKASAIGKRTVLVTLTFPDEFSNDMRWRINDRIRKLVRMIFKDGGVWCVEAHTGKEYKDRNGKTVSNLHMRGRVHFHYRIITDKPFSEVLRWIVDQQNKDGVARNSYDISERESTIYQSVYQSKQDQKNLVSHSGRLFAVWCVDTKGMKVDQSQIDLFGYEFTGSGVMRSKLRNANVIVQQSKL